MEADGLFDPVVRQPLDARELAQEIVEQIRRSQEFSLGEEVHE
jgi:hypothetical protein